MRARIIRPRYVSRHAKHGGLNAVQSSCANLCHITGRKRPSLFADIASSDLIVKGSQVMDGALFQHLALAERVIREMPVWHHRLEAPNHMKQLSFTMVPPEVGHRLARMRVQRKGRRLNPDEARRSNASLQKPTTQKPTTRWGKAGLYQ